MMTLQIIAVLKNPSIANELNARGPRLFILTIFVVLNASQDLDIKSKLISTFIPNCVTRVTLQSLNTGSRCLSRLLSLTQSPISSE